MSRTGRSNSVTMICPPHSNARPRGCDTTQEWLGEPVDIIAIHLDYDDTQGAPYYNLKMLCNEEDLAGVPRVIRDNERAGTDE